MILVEEFKNKLKKYMASDSFDGKLTPVEYYYLAVGRFHKISERDIFLLKEECNYFDRKLEAIK